MTEKKRSQQQQDVGNKEQGSQPESERDAGKGTRQYESGKNPDMQVQRSNRQGDGSPTQQGRNDR